MDVEFEDVTFKTRSSFWNRSGKTTVSSFYDIATVRVLVICTCTYIHIYITYVNMYRSTLNTIPSHLPYTIQHSYVKVTAVKKKKKKKEKKDRAKEANYEQKRN